MAQDPPSLKMSQPSRANRRKNFAQISSMAMSFLAASILSGCGGGSSAPASTVPTPAISISVNASSSQAITQGQFIVLTAAVSNDSSGKGVTWKLAGPGSFSKQTGTSVEYDAPAVVAGAVVASITATSVADPTKSATATVNVNPPVLAIVTASLADAVVGTSYSQFIQATGGVAPFSWMVSTGTLPHNLALDNSTTSTLTIAGTPDVQQTAVQFVIKVTDSANQSATMAYTVNINNPSTLTISTSSIPSGTVGVAYSSFSFTAAGGASPFTWNERGTMPAGLTLGTDGTLTGTPTAAGSFPITVTANDSTGHTAAKPFTVVVSPTSTLSGRYIFQFQGFNGAGGFGVLGSFNADGSGNITDAVLDTNGVGSPPVKNLALAGTYSFDSTSLGTMTLSGSQGNATFRFALYPSVSGGAATGGKVIEFNGIKSGTGFIAAQDTTAFSKSAINGDYLFNFAGSSASMTRVVTIGRLTADGVGGFNSGVLDMNNSGTVFSAAAFTGNYDVSGASTNGRGTAVLNTTLGGAAVKLSFSFYIQNIDTIPNAAILIFLGNDPVSASTPLLMGSMEPHAVAFSNSSLSGFLIVSATGLTSTGLPDVSAGVMSVTSAGNYTLTADENNGGTVTTNNAAGTYSVDPNGRVTVTGGAHPPVIYLSGQNSGYVLGTDGSAAAGTLSDRAVPLSLEGSLFVKTVPPVDSNQENDFGTLTFSSGEVTGSLNIGSSTSFQPNITVIGKYSLSSDGKGVLSITSGLHPGTSVFYLTGHSRLVLLNSNSPGDNTPVLFTGGCIHFVSSPRGGETCQ